MAPKKGIRGKPIDFMADREKPFKNYRLKASAKAVIDEHIDPDKVDELVASLEYLGSRKLDDLLDAQCGPGVSFLSSELNDLWIIPWNKPQPKPIAEIMQAVSSGEMGKIDVPIFAESHCKMAVTLLLSPDCFEENPDGPENQRLQ